MIVETGIVVNSLCSHHNLPFKGEAAIGYIPSSSSSSAVIGLSKLNRIVDWFARRPQIQENLTVQIHEYLNKILTHNNGIIVYLKCTHGCVECRGVKQKGASMITCIPSGFFYENKDGCKTEFFNYLK
jgi:GTP cyclohydrolase I